MIKKQDYRDTSWDVIVVGGGHSGCEAACASARLSAKTLLITKSLCDIGIMACNPSIGGVGKGHLVKEIDALDGVMGFVADRSSIHSRVLNTKKGPAVQALRVQCDRYLYQRNMYNIISSYPNLTLREAIVSKILMRNKRTFGVVVDGDISLYARSVILTSGTSMQSSVLRGKQKIDKKENGKMISQQLVDSGCTSLRFKTGTPPRIKASSINWDEVNKQFSDEASPFFSHIANCYRHHLACGLTYTKQITHEIIRENITLSPNFNGSVKGIGPRYCPSIEDKITRFSHNDSHHVFLEPEGLYTDVIYPNGLSNALPEFVQKDFIQSIPSLEKAHISQYGYTIEYDCFSPLNLFHTLEVKTVCGLFLAGQINGTTGYEEAAAQGIVAGTNGALSLCGKSFILRRDDSYIGVLIDDLVAKGTSEPYRMFTSRSESRLHLRFDNADLRVTPLGEEIGLISEKRRRVFKRKLSAYSNIKKYTESIILSPKTQDALFSKKENCSSKKRSIFEVLHNLSYEDCCAVWKNMSLYPRNIFAIVQNDSLYFPYVQREKNSSLVRNSIHITIPQNVNYSEISGISKEVEEILIKKKPSTIGEMIQIEGITPAAVTRIIHFLSK